MTHAGRFVAVIAVLTALALCVPVQAQTRFVDALRARAEAGDAEAQYNLGVSYAYGQGVPEDDVEAVRWFRLAADQGSADAQYSLGVMYADGQGVPQDYVQAHMWYNLVASRQTVGFPGGFRHTAAEARDRVADLMTPTQITEPQRLATEWDAAHPREP